MSQCVCIDNENFVPSGIHPKNNKYFARLPLLDTIRVLVLWCSSQNSNATTVLSGDVTIVQLTILAVLSGDVTIVQLTNG